jgi:predicted ArsR family transcriptional regulator
MPTLPVLQDLSKLDVNLDRDVFMRTLIRELAGTLEDVVGLEEASGFITVVGQAMGDEIGRGYKAALGLPAIPRERLAEVLVDLKRRIHGDFYVLEEDEEKIVLGNRACPFGDKVIGRRSMCMMTSNVFGAIAADSVGYAKVELQETIAAGDPGCRVIVWLRQTPESDAREGREYLKAP